MSGTRRFPGAGQTGGPRRFKQILYCAPDKARAEAFLEDLGNVPGCRRLQEAGGAWFEFEDFQIRFAVQVSAAAAHEALHHTYFNLVILDVRAGAGPLARLQEEFAGSMDLLDRMDAEPDVERRYGFHRIMVLISGPDSAEVDELITKLGARGVGRVLRDTSVCAIDPGCSRLPSRHSFARLVLDEIFRITLGRRPGKTALCASGGGVTGIYFEMGALKCLDDCLGSGAVNAFDMYFGISAGAVVTSILANGYTMDEFMAGIAGAEGFRIEPTSLGLLRLSHVNPVALLAPITNLARGVSSTFLDAFRGKARLSLESLLLEYNDFLAAPFKADGFEQMLNDLFTRSGRVNDFRRLERPLFIGATDQDAREHVLFGEKGFDDVPISLAVQASISINPAFSATRIGDRFYVDGAVTRTSNFVESIRKGADLIFALDPLVPYVSKGLAGFAHDRGILYNADQDIRTVSFTRFETTRYWVLRQHPSVSLYTFLPANRLRKVLSVNPMDHRPYLQIWKGAYLSTFQRVQLLKHRMAGDLAVHGLSLRTDRAEEVASRLEATRDPSFEDFFPDRKVDIRSFDRTEHRPRVAVSAAPDLPVFSAPASAA